MFTETLRTNETDTGFTMLTNDSSSAFAMAEKMAFAGYKVKLSGVKGGEWEVIVSETDEVNQHANV